MLNIAVDFYKNLFGKENRLNKSLDNNFWKENERVTAAENDFLGAPFTDFEVKETIFVSYAEGAPSPDGLPFLFYQQFLECIKNDLIAMFQAFWEGNLNLSRLNYTTVILIPKENDAKTLKKIQAD
jgi:hypothetical protein